MFEITDDQIENALEGLEKYLFNEAIKRVKQIHPTIVFATEEEKYKVYLAIKGGIPAAVEKFCEEIKTVKPEVDALIDRVIDKGADYVVRAASEKYQDVLRARAKA